MMRVRFYRKAIPMVLFMAVLLAGCRSSAPPVKFYTLNAVNAEAQNASPVDSSRKIVVGVGPVQLPPVLDRPQIVTRTGPNTIALNEFNRWAGPLQADFTRVLAENIAARLSIDEVAVYPWEVDFTPDYRIALEVRHFEGQWGKNVLLDVTWTITGRSGQNTLALKKSVITEPLPAEDYEALVAAESLAIAQLSREIAQQIRQLQSEVKGN